MSYKLKIINSDEDTKSFYLNDNYITSVNHDSDGWSGIEKVENSLVTFAKMLGVEVEEAWLD